jgi:hypothetical protein
MALGKLLIVIISEFTIASPDLKFMDRGQSR